MKHVKIYENENPAESHLVLDTFYLTNKKKESSKEQLFLENPENPQNPQIAEHVLWLDLLPKYSDESFGLC